MIEGIGSDIASRPVRRVVIAGGGTAGWMAAAALSRTLGKVVQVTLVESEEIGTIGVGEATIPPLMTFHRLLDIGEQAFLSETQGTIKLGINFEGWADIGKDYFHSFGLTGTDHWTAGFQHFWMKGRERKLAGEYGEYCVELKAAEQGRFAHLPKRKLNYAYHMDASLYARYLRRFSEANGARRIEGKIAQVVTDDASGFITALALEDGTRVEGDFFIDCTGFRALLIEKALGVEFIDWSHWLFNDRAFAVPTTTVRDAVPYTRSIAGEAGWQWRIPLQHRVGNGIVYSSRYMDDERARETLLSSVEGTPVREPFQVRFRPGQRSRCWHRNCVALGLSASFIEPLESTTIHLIQRGIVHLMQTFPRVVSQPDIDQYNAQMDAELQHARDFVILHFHVTDRQDTQYWRDCREMSIPASLRHRIELFRETGRVFHVPPELFAENSWIQVMMGQGIVPRQYHQSADLMGDEELAQFLGEIRGNVERLVRQLPPHMDYIRNYAPGVPPAG
jgi:tryptophan 7-halogenase